MCWSGEASAVLATIGLGTTAYAAYKKEPPALWIALGYFSLMELLQAYTYAVIDDCDSPANQIATLLGYIHIAFQPFFINLISLYFLPKPIAEKIAPWAYTACFVSVIVMIIQLMPMDWAGQCNLDRILCGPELCSVSGEWHIAWDLPLNGLGNWLTYTPMMGHPTYWIVGFVMPLFYGSWRMTIYHALVGPILAKQLTSNPNEMAAIWCLLSIGILLIVAKTPVRHYLHVKRWWLWPKKYHLDESSTRLE